MPNMLLNGTAFFGAPKNGGTTVRMWLKHVEGTLPQEAGSGGYYSLKPFGMPSQWHDNVVDEPRFFRPAASAAVTWCIVRDPLERFVSAYTDKVLNEALVDWSVEDCIGLLESGRMEQLARTRDRHSLAASHFLPQAAWLGSDRAYYDFVFNLAQMRVVKRFCEARVFCMSLPDFHARNLARSEVAKISLSPDQRRRLEAVYRADFAAGWC